MPGNYCHHEQDSFLDYNTKHIPVMVYLVNEVKSSVILLCIMYWRFDMCVWPQKFLRLCSKKKLQSWITLHYVKRLGQKWFLFQIWEENRSVEAARKSIIWIFSSWRYTRSSFLIIILFSFWRQRIQLWVLRFTSQHIFCGGQSRTEGII